MLNITKYDDQNVSLEETTEMGKLVTDAMRKRDLAKDGKLLMTVTMEVKESQALALKQFFECWNSLSSMGSSRMVSFFVDGDGDFKPNCQIQYSKDLEALSLPEDKLNFILNGAKVSKDGEEPIAFDYDSVAWRLRSIKNNCICIENKVKADVSKGYFLGIQKGYNVEVPGFGSFDVEVGVKGTIPIWCFVCPEVISIHQQKYNDAIDGYQPYDWEEQKWLPFDKFNNHKS